MEAVTPAKAGDHKYPKSPDSLPCGDDKKCEFLLFRNVSTLMVPG